MRGQSELGRLIQRIDAENRAAAWALNATHLGAAKHRFIERRMVGIGMAHKQLQYLVGEYNAAQILVERLNMTGDVREP